MVHKVGTFVAHKVAHKAGTLVVHKVGMFVAHKAAHKAGTLVAHKVVTSVDPKALKVASKEEVSYTATGEQPRQSTAMS